ncbi:hypothetical protein [Catenibacterium mitsuokai]|uniref:hypothetical protein n=2 Tax=Catenibacterium mitsuokai TaxID=100886 RepID=UPI003F89814D
MVMIRPEMEMKDSGVQWLGNVPKEWSVGKVKHEFYVTKTIVGDKVNDYERLALTLNGVIKRSKDAGDGLQPEKFDGYQILKEHELVFKLIDLANVSTSRVGLSPYTGIVSPAYIVLHHRKDMNPRYGEYYFLSMWMNEVFNHIGGDGVRSALNAKDLLNIPYLKVSSDEQQAIANYLDEKCSKIDEIIAEAKASIDEYKELKQSVIFEAVTKGLDKNVEMKDSGVEWIGEIPESWNIRMLNQYVSQVKCKNSDLSETNLLSLSYGKIKRKNINSNDGLLPESFDNYNVVDENDIVLRLTDLQNDHKSLRVGLVTERGIITSAYVTIRPNGINAAYLALLLHAFDYKKGFYGMGSGIRQGLTFDGIKSLKIVVPSNFEQDDIVKHIMKMTEKCDSLISEKESLINDLEAYKKSLIYEVVTGKRRVV